MYSLVGCLLQQQVLWQLIHPHQFVLSFPDNPSLLHLHAPLRPIYSAFKILLTSISYIIIYISFYIRQSILALLRNLIISFNISGSIYSKGFHIPFQLVVTSTFKKRLKQKKPSSKTQKQRKITKRHDINVTFTVI